VGVRLVVETVTGPDRIDEVNTLLQREPKLKQIAISRTTKAEICQKFQSGTG
jgi:hypothetical protein